MDNDGQINLAPKAAHESELDSISGLSLQDHAHLQLGSGSLSPTGATINGDQFNRMSGSMEQHHQRSGSSSPMTVPSSGRPRSRTSSHDGLNGGNRSRAGSSVSTNNNNNANNAGNPGGSADTRRRITKLSKVREREKVPRLVEYFCVVSSVPLKGSMNGSYNNNNGNVHPPSSPSRSKNVTKIEAMPQTPFVKSNNTSNKKNPNPNNLDGSEFQPQITARYPLLDHEENPLLPESITAFCYPSGKIPIIHGDNGVQQANTMPKVHYFVTTGESGQKMYGTCLTVWEGHEITIVVKEKNQESVDVVYLPKCLVILSLHPYLVAFREYLVQLHRLSKMAPPDTADSNINNAGGGIVTTTTASSNIMKTVLTLPIERYITNFCSELPAPPPGSFQVQTTILDSVISIWSPPHNVPIAWVSLPFSQLFQCLDVENVLVVWTALALERQVLVTSTQLSLLTTCCEILLSLLFPMKWSHAYIPVLPHFLVPILSAPMPFLCGIDKRHLADTMEDLADECIVVDLDKNMVSLGTNTEPLPTLPKYIYQRLKNKVEANAGHVHREVRSLRKQDNTSEMGIHLPPDVKGMADAMWESRLFLFDEAFMLTFTPEERRKNLLNGDDGSGGGHSDPKANLLMTLSEKQNLRSQSQWDAVQESFLETYCFLLQKYRKFLKFPAKQNEGAYGGAGFRSQEFLAAQRSDVRDFSEALVGSQMFDDFVTKRLYGSGEADISFFDTAVDRYVKNNSLVANVRGLVRESSTGSAAAGKGDTPRGNRMRKMFGGGRGAGGGGKGGVGLPTNASEKDPPLLQSARVKRELKTIVPPEPCGVDLPDSVDSFGLENGMVVRVTTKREESAQVMAVDDDDISIASVSTTASTAVGGRVYYHYPTFPELLDPNLFGVPRPMSSAVRAEYDRQREKVGKFRRSSTDDSSDIAKNVSSARSAAVTGQLGPVEKPATSEVTSFTVFFVVFMAVVGKDLMAVDNDTLDTLDSKSIISTYAGHRKKEKQQEEAEEIANFVDEIVMDADLPQTPTKKERPRSERLGGNEAASSMQKSPARNRFNDKLSTLKIMEAKETSKAELVIAFEMLNMMKERGLRADPEAYQCLIDACGRCGDTDRATELLSRMHEDGIVADGVVYSSLVSAFSAENAWKQASGEVREELPEWANGASIDMDWNTLKMQKRSYIDIVKEKIGATDENGDHPAGLRNTFNRIVGRGKKTNQTEKNKDASSSNNKDNNGYTEQYATDQVLRQILLGENLLEVVYPDISIDTDNEFCPRCNFYLSDDDVVAGWSAGNSQEYKTECPNCLTKFVPHFCVQSTLPSFVGSRGPSSALFCERLSPWVLKKELRSVISGGIEDLLSPEWRERESKNAVLWWNLILSFMRYRFPFTFLLQGSFSSSLIAPTPGDGDDLDI